MTSLAVPSPPTATTSLPPASTASRARRAPSPRSLVKAHSKSPTAVRTARAILSKWRPVRPEALTGLTISQGFMRLVPYHAARGGAAPAGGRAAMARSVVTIREMGTWVGQRASQPLQPLAATHAERASAASGSSARFRE